ncbi:hypothetical protein F2Q69_00049038 [Brassica cretica]|uniref:Uncharacterized protein n=1 Tax=Brassica cretica TaxID=69181 RepID=A0A8S9PVS8_BRACR|nr:hypothetical protein F2Q69_00049038 [Brassica cretica]
MGWLLNGHRGCATMDELALLLNNHLVFPSPLLYTVASSHSRRPSTAGIIHTLRFTIKPHYIRTSRRIRPYFAAASLPLPLRPSPSPVSTTVSSPTGSAAIKSRSAISKQKEVKRKHASETWAVEIGFNPIFSFIRKKPYYVTFVYSSGDSYLFQTPPVRHFNMLFRSPAQVNLF